MSLTVSMRRKLGSRLLSSKLPLKSSSNTDLVRKTGVRATRVGDDEEDHVQAQVEFVFRVEAEFDAEELEQIEYDQ